MKGNVSLALYMAAISPVEPAPPDLHHNPPLIALQSATQFVFAGNFDYRNFRSAYDILGERNVYVTSSVDMLDT